MMRAVDHLVKATAEGVRIHAAVTTDLVNEAVRRHDCWPVAAAALGRTMTGALLFAANLKNEEAVTIRFKGCGPLGVVTADAVPEGFVRGYVAHPHVDLPLNDQGKLDVGTAIGPDGIVSVTRFTGLKDPVTGSAPLANGEIAEDLTKYLYVSEQTPSSVGLGVLVERDLKVKSAGGFLLQPLPGAEDEIITQLEENLKSLRPVSSMIAEEMGPREIIAEVLKGFSVSYLTTTDLAFRCQCSRERIEEMLMNLGTEDLQSLIDDRQAEVCCQFCAEKYQFTKEELEALKAKAEERKQQK